jgi:hypothetical protein
VPTVKRDVEFFGAKVWKNIRNIYAIYSEYFGNVEAIWKIGDGIGYFEERNEENKCSLHQITNETRKFAAL